MCDPATAMTVLSVAQGVSSYQQGSAVADQRNAESAQNRINATNARDLKIQQLSVRNSQEQEKANEEKRELSLEAYRRQATARVAAGESNVGGQSFDALMREFDSDLLNGLQRIDQDADAVNYQMGIERQGLEAETMNRIASIQPVAGPDPLAAAIGIASTAFATNAQFGGGGLDSLKGLGNKASAASGLKYDTNFMSEQSLMLAAQEF